MKYFFSVLLHNIISRFPETEVLRTTHVWVIVGPYLDQQLLPTSIRIFLWACNKLAWVVPIFITKTNLFCVKPIITSFQSKSVMKSTLKYFSAWLQIEIYFEFQVSNLLSSFKHLSQNYKFLFFHTLSDFKLLWTTEPNLIGFKSDLKLSFIDFLAMSE